MSRSVVIVCMVSRLIANYPCTIAFCGDNANVSVCPDPSSSPCRGSGVKRSGVKRSMLALFGSGE